MAKTAGGHGRDVTITDARTRKVCEAVRAGSSLEVSAKFAGIPRETFWGWVREGRKDDGDPKCRTFVERLDRAFAECAHARAQGVTEAGGKDGDWRADAFWLERRMPDEWGKTTRIDGQVQHQQVPWLDLSKLDDAEIETLRTLVAKARPDVADLPRGASEQPLELTTGAAA